MVVSTRFFGLLASCMPDLVPWTLSRALRNGRLSKKVAVIPLQSQQMGATCPEFLLAVFGSFGNVCAIDREVDTFPAVGHSPRIARSVLGAFGKGIQHERPRETGGPRSHPMDDSA